MRHLLAYGNSDQASFRNAEVRNSFDVMTVPGTIAAYYPEATAGFVLSSQIDYLIDPRTPLFQDFLDAPRASHFALAEWHGSTVAATLGDDGANFDTAFWSPDVVDEMVRGVVRRQREYDENGPLVQTKLDRYAALLAEALAEQGEQRPARETKKPYCILAPYFAVSGVDDPWWQVMQSVWSTCASLRQPKEIIPVLCVDGRPQKAVDGVTTLEALLPLVPQSLSRACFFWITNFDERKASEEQLRHLWQVVVNNGDSRSLVNMYGGFFSICLRYAGLAAFGNGLTYSEFRDWPALNATGAAPPRYYVRDLHAFLSPAVAAQLVAADDSFVCPCSACTDWRATGQTIASLPYHDLKRHFALARRWELDTTESSTPTDIAATLRNAKERLDLARSNNMVLGSLQPADYLNRWSAVLTNP